MDLRFKIIADYVAAGWDKSKAAVGSLKASMADFFRSSVGGWGRFAGGATAAFTAVLAAAKTLRDGVLRELDAMEVRDVANVDWNERFARKAGKVSTDDEKNKLQEEVNREYRDTKMKFDQLMRKEETQFPWEELKDAAERKINEAMGLGNKTDDERMLDQLGDRLAQLKRKAEYVRNLKVESRFEAFQAEENAFNEEQMRVRDLENTTDAIAKEKKAAEQLAAAMKDLDAAREVFRDNPNDEAAETAIKRQFELVKKLTSAWESAAKEAEDYDPPATTARKPYVDPWGPDMGGGKNMDKPERPTGKSKERDSRGRLLETPEFSYGPEMGESLTESHVGKLSEGHGGAGFGSRGGHITKFRKPAFLERAIAMREGKTGRNSDQEDPRLIEMKKQTKLLEGINEKTGAAP